MTVTASRKPSPVFWNVIKIIIALLLVVFVLSRTDREQLLSLFEHISLPWLGLRRISSPITRICWRSDSR
jgi:uncharacterized integral membrane protein